MRLRFLPPDVLPETRLLLWGRGLRAFGDGLVSLLLPFYLTLLGFDPFAIGVLTAATLAGSAALTLVVGFTAHRFGQRGLLLRRGFPLDFELCSRRLQLRLSRCCDLRLSVSLVELSPDALQLDLRVLDGARRLLTGFFELGAGGFEVLHLCRIRGIKLHRRVFEGRLQGHAFKPIRFTRGGDLGKRQVEALLSLATLEFQAGPA